MHSGPCACQKPFLVWARRVSGQGERCTRVRAVRGAWCKQVVAAQLDSRKAPFKARQLQAMSGRTGACKCPRFDNPSQLFLRKRSESRTTAHTRLTKDSGSSHAQVSNSRTVIWSTACKQNESTCQLRREICPRAGLNAYAEKDGSHKCELHDDLSENHHAKSTLSPRWLVICCLSKSHLRGWRR